MQRQQRSKSTETKLKKLNNIFGQKIGIMIHSGKWKKLQAHFLFQYSQQINAKQLELYGNKEPKIIKSLTYPYMANLTHLNLRNNKIISIEGLGSLQAPNLLYLSLGDNDITYIRQLTKLYAPELVELSFYANRIIDLQPLQNTNFRQLKYLILGLNAASNFSGLNKCNWDTIQKISLQNNRKCGRLSSFITKWSHQPQIVYG